MMAQDPVKHFNPPAPCGAGRRPAPAGRTAGRNFNPPAPCGAGPSGDGCTTTGLHFNPPAPCGAGHSLRCFCSLASPISIHPPRAGRDLQPKIAPVIITYFNPPAPCGAGRGAGGPVVIIICDFNPPAPCGAGPQGIFRGCALWNFNPPAPCGAGRYVSPSFSSPLAISIHPPRAGRDNIYLDHYHHNEQFQSTRPVRGGTWKRPSINDHKIPFQSTRPVRGGTAF